MKKIIYTAVFLSMALHPLFCFSAGLSGSSANVSAETQKENKGVDNLKKSEAQQTGQVSLSEVLQMQGNSGQAQSVQQDARAQALQGTPQTGYAGTWKDPSTGDVMTSVIAPTPQTNSQQQYPMIIAPQVSGSSGNNYYGNNGYYPNNPYNWPVSPDNTGYPQSIPYPGWMPPYPGQPYPGFNPYPGMNYPPGYRPQWGDAPNPPQGFIPPPPPDFNPNYKPSVPVPFPPPYFPPIPSPYDSVGPVENQGGIFNQNQYNRANPPQIQQPLPLNPAGNTWNTSPFAPRSSGQGIFNNRERF